MESDCRVPAGSGAPASAPHATSGNARTKAPTTGVIGARRTTSGSFVVAVSGATSDDAQAMVPRALLGAAVIETLSPTSGGASIILDKGNAKAKRTASDKENAKMPSAVSDKGKAKVQRAGDQDTTGEPESVESESVDKSGSAEIIKSETAAAGDLVLGAGVAQKTGEPPGAKDQETTGEPASFKLESADKSANTEIVTTKSATDQPVFKPVTAGPASALAEQPMRLAQEPGKPASGDRGLGWRWWWWPWGLTAGAKTITAPRATSGEAQAKGSDTAVVEAKRAIPGALAVAVPGAVSDEAQAMVQRASSGEGEAQAKSARRSARPSAVKARAPSAHPSEDKIKAESAKKSAKPSADKAPERSAGTSARPSESAAGVRYATGEDKAKVKSAGGGARLSAGRAPVRGAKTSASPSEGVARARRAAGGARPGEAKAQVKNAKMGITPGEFKYQYRNPSRGFYDPANTKR